VRPPDLMHSEWRCDSCGPVPPLHVAEHIGAEIVVSATERVIEGSAGGRPRVPVWCPWPLLPGWTMTGIAWAGDERTGVRATAAACSGPAPLGDGPADLLLVAEEPGVGLGARLAGIEGPDPGARLAEAMGWPDAGRAGHPPHAKIKAAGHPTPLWLVESTTDRSAYVGEARGLWLYAITWPANAGYLFAEHLALQDLVEWLPPELVYGAPSPHLPGRA
jgi:hypothetical protein